MEGDQVVGLAYAKDADLLVVTENGFGKEHLLKSTVLKPGAVKVFTQLSIPNNLRLVSLMVVEPGDDIMVISMKEL